MQFTKRVSWPLLILPILIFAIGEITLISTTPELAKNQFIFFIVGAIGYLIISLTNYRIFQYFWKWIYGGVIFLLLLVYVLGTTLFGSSRWLSIGSFSLQPSEFAKVAVVILLASIISENKYSIKNIKNLIKVILYIIPVFLLVFVQPDLGTSLIILGVVVGVLWFAGLNKFYYVIVAIISGIFSMPLWNLLKDYQKERILVFLNPALDVLGSGYNVIQSTIAVGSGEIVGRGFGRGTQSHLQFLPVYWTDFIFAAFAEEWGFVGVVVFLILFFLLLLTIISVAVKAKDTFGSLLTSGVFIIFFFQFVINVGMNMGIMPVTGIPLPLVSYGGSSFLTSMLLLGMVQSVWIHEKIR